jgi:hypothetical protein
MVEALHCCAPVARLLEVLQAAAVLAPDLMRPEHARRGLLIDVLLQQRYVTQHVP